MAEAARSCMDHHPELAVLVVLQLREVVTATQAAKLADSAPYGFFWRLPGVIDRNKVPLGGFALIAKGVRAGPDDLLKLLLGERLLAALANAQADTRHHLLGEFLAQPVVQALFHGDIGAKGHHAAADIKAHGRLAERAVGRHHAADRDDIPAVGVGRDDNVGNAREAGCRRDLRKDRLLALREELFGHEDAYGHLHALGQKVIPFVRLFTMPFPAQNPTPSLLYPWLPSEAKTPLSNAAAFLQRRLESK